MLVNLKEILEDAKNKTIEKYIKYYKKKNKRKTWVDVSDTILAQCIGRIKLA